MKLEPDLSNPHSKSPIAGQVKATIAQDWKAEDNSVRGNESGSLAKLIALAAGKYLPQITTIRTAHPNTPFKTAVDVTYFGEFDDKNVDRMYYDDYWYVAGYPK